jgi:hypothetical protein
MTIETRVMLDSDEPDPRTVVVDSIPKQCNARRPALEAAKVECGGGMTETGFGLAGGGYGAYAECLRCGRFYKVLVDDSEG